MTDSDPIAELLRAPLAPDWTIDGLADAVLDRIARDGSAPRGFVVDAADLSDRQSQRLLRPLLACLATKAASETGAAVELYGGALAFRRTAAAGPVWVVGWFENRPDRARLALLRSAVPFAEPRPPVARGA